MDLRRCRVRRIFIALCFLLLLSRPAAATIAFVAGGCGTSTDSGLTATTASINMTGATLIVISHTWYNVVGRSPISDSSSNSYTALNNYTAGSVLSTTLFYVASPTVTSSMTFTAGSVGGNFPVICVAGFSGTAASTPFDVQNGGGSLGFNPVQPGSITPSVNNELVVSGYGNAASGAPNTMSIDSGFTISSQTAGAAGASWGGAIAYLIQTSASAVNPTWSTTSVTASSSQANIASFKCGGCISINTGFTRFLSP